MILLDTCVILRLDAEPLLPQALGATIDQERWAASSLSAWEIGIKHAVGKLPLDALPAIWWQRFVSEYQVTVFDFTSADALAAAALPLIHNDPFDRGIIATAMNRNLNLATIDGVFAHYAKSCGLTLA